MDSKVFSAETYILAIVAVVAITGIVIMLNSSDNEQSYGKATAVVTQTTSLGNAKNSAMYAQTPAFIVSDSDWTKVLEMVPVSIYNENGAIKNNPLLIYHEEPQRQFYINLASPFYGASITASSSYNYNDRPERLIDDVIGSVWNSGSIDPAWIVIDLGSVKRFSRIDVYDYAEPYYLSIQVAGADQQYRTIISKNQLSISTGPNTFTTANMLGNAYGINVTGARYVKFIVEDSPAQLKYPNWKQLNEIRIFDTSNPITATPFDADSIINFLQTFQPGQIYMMSNPPTELQSLTKSISSSYTYTQYTPSPQNILAFWSQYSEIVLSEKNYEIAMLASTYASLHNAPLIINGDSINLSVYQGKKVYLIGSVTCPAGAGQCISYPTKAALQQQYMTETQSNKLILVNANDLNMKVDTELYPEKSTWQINQLYTKTSLAAPILASAKKELILFTEVPEIKIPLDNDVMKIDSTLWTNAQQIIADIHTQLQAITTGSTSFNYMTIIGAPNAIPDGHVQPNFGYIILMSQDNNYATISPGNTLNVGRLYGLSISDVSSNIARDIFYDKLKSKIYGGSSTASIISRFTSKLSDTTRTLPAVNWLKSLGYNVMCSTQYPGGCQDTNSYPLDDSFFQNKQIITHDDHGYDNLWGTTKGSYDLPWLQLPIVMAPDACNTNHFWDINNVASQFGATMIRKGAISYTGAIDVNIYENLPTYYNELAILLSAGAYTQGQAYSAVYDPIQVLSLRGDPVLSLSLLKSTKKELNCIDYHGTTPPGTPGYILFSGWWGGNEYPDSCHSGPNGEPVYTATSYTCDGLGLKQNLVTTCTYMCSKEGTCCDYQKNPSDCIIGHGGNAPAINPKPVVTLNMITQPTIKSGGNVKFDFRINSDTTGQAQVITQINCPSTGTAPLNPQYVNITANQTYNGTYSSITVTNNIPSQTCTAIIIVNYYNTSINKTTNFDIVTLPKIYVKTMTCKDAACNTPSKVFSSGDQIYIKTVTSNLDGTPIPTPIISKSVTNTQTKQSFGNTIQSTTSGEYQIVTSASLNGYISSTDKEIYTVLPSSQTQ